MEESTNITAENENLDPATENTALKPAPVEKLPWSVLIFLGGENNLSDEMIFAIKAMKSSVHLPPKSAGKEKFKFHAAVQFAAEYSLLSSPIRFALRPGDFDGSTHGDYVETYESDRAPSWPGDGSYLYELIDFLYWGITHFPAEKYFVILSGHGKGVESNFLVKDSVPPQSLTIKQLQDVIDHDDVWMALKSVDKTDVIDILGFDSCLMSMIEVCYELRDNAKLLVGSQGSEANLGWPYKAVFEYLQENCTDTPDKLAKAVVDATVMYYLDFSIIANSSADLSVADLAANKIKELVAAIDEFAKSLLAKLPEPHESGESNETAGSEKDDVNNIEKDELLRTLIFAHWYAQTYYSDQYADIADFCDVLSSNLNPASFKEIIAACKRVIRAIKDNFIIYHCYTGPMYQYSNGISIYFPWAQIYPLYENARPSLEFLKHTHWLKFIQRYIKVTQRPPKPGEKISKNVSLYRSKDDFPRTRGLDDPAMRAKNPAQIWNVPGCFTDYGKARLTE